MFDISICVFTLLGVGLGVWRGFFRTVILVLASYLPMIGLAIYFDAITGFIDITLRNMGDSNTAALAGLGTFAGIIAVVGFVVATFLGTRVLLQVLRFHEPDRWDRFFGAFAGATANTIMASMVYFMMFTASPVSVSKAVAGSLWTQALYPVHAVVYPQYRQFMLARTQRLHRSIATKGLADTILHGVSLQQLHDVVSGGDTPVTDVVLEKLQSVIGDLDIEELQKTIGEIDASGLNPEEIDRQIALEEARRRAVINEQLGLAN